MSVTLRMSGFERSLSDIRKAMEAYAGGHVYCTVGVHRDAERYDDGNTVAMVAASNHFGTDKIPARPFLDKGVENAREVIARSIAYDMKNGKAPRQVIASAGALAVRGVQEQIDKTLTPPNSPITIKRKKSSHPLIDTGHMKASITFKLRNRLGEKEE